jgi:phospholipid/cholesterol/gamma-HCH transport system ATP-binding protein
VAVREAEIRRATGTPRVSEIQDVHIDVRDLYKSYGGQPVLRGINLQIERNHTNVIIGGSGAGKTVLLRQLIGLERPDRGQVLIDGEDICVMNDVALNEVRRKFGMVFQGAALFDSMTVYENVAFPLREHGKLSESEIGARVRERLADLGLEGADQKMPGQLSGGMKKRVGVARALMLEPQILIYDEPTTGLDPILSRSVDEIIRKMRARFHVTSVVISHDMASAFGVADRMAMLHEGQIVAQGRPDEFLANESPVVQEFVRSSGVNPEVLEEE